MDLEAEIRTLQLGWADENNAIVIPEDRNSNEVKKLDDKAI